MRLFALILALFCAACSKPSSKPDQEPPTVSVLSVYANAVDRLLGSYVENGWVVSRRPDGAPEHVGDSLLWTGLALSALPCSRGQELEDNLILMIRRHGGALVRHEPLGEYAGGREVSVDGALGLYRGIAHRVWYCGSSKWAEALGLHWRYLRANNWQLNTGAKDGLIIGGLDYVPSLLASRFAFTGAPDAAYRGALEAAVVTWAAAANSAHASCYRIHLGWLAFDTIESAGGKVSPDARAAFCESTRGTDIPIVDNWCGRGNLKAWIDGFEFNRWEYQFQRCPRWESPDAGEVRTPALDLLVAIKAAYSL